MSRKRMKKFYPYTTFVSVWHLHRIKFGVRPTYNNTLFEFIQILTVILL